MAAVLAPVGLQVGLKLLLEPFGSTVGEVACGAVGILYPAYASFKAVEVMRMRNDASEAERWLTYWAVYGAFTTVERLVDKAVPWVPYYSTVKLVLLLWLQLPRYSGAQRLSRQFVRPFLRRAHPHIDAFLTALRYSLTRPELLSLAATLNDVFSRVPVLEWFVRGPDGRPVHSRGPPPREDDGRGNFIAGR